MSIEKNKICDLVSVKKSLNWVKIYTCGCCFNEVIQIKWKKLSWKVGMRFHRFYPII